MKLLAESFIHYLAQIKHYMVQKPISKKPKQLTIKDFFTNK